ncbi:MAG: putative type Fe3+ transport system, periplasmic component [Candidatus Eremiobacteraeota bacterium]|nr:putative type Fe3+ transport system, periplasmic component [Candidatus Eremiobacteraeota bacterium]
MLSKLLRLACRAAAVAMALAMLAPVPVSPASFVVPDVAKAKAEGLVVFYTSVDVSVAERLARDFQSKYGIKVQVERTGSERVFQRIGQEMGSNLHVADVVNTSDAANFLVWKNSGWLANVRMEEIERYWPPQFRDRDDTFATWRATLSPIAYNSSLVKQTEAPSTWADLLQPRWKSRLVKAHPAYSGSEMTANYELMKAFGWNYLQKLGDQKVMQVQSSTEPPKVLSRGEQPVMAGGNEYVVFQLQAQGSPLVLVYPPEGTPFETSPAAIFKDAPHPNAARLFYQYLFSKDTQQMLVDFGGLRSVRAGLKEPANRIPITRIRLFHDDPQGVLKTSDEMKTKYAQYFGT